MKKFLIVAFAALGFVACNDNNFDDVNNGGFTGEVETSYIAINLNAAENGTRADAPAYQDGLDAERLVNAAYFFFFDPEGNAFPVTGSPATEPGGSVNWISANLTGSGTEAPNVSDIKDAVLVLSTYKGDYPSQIVAVINWVPKTGEKYGLEDKQIVCVKVESDGRKLVFDDVVVRVNPNFALAMHIDTDESNAGAFKGEVYGEIVKL